MSEPGRLIVCATPIGNLGDLTFRVLDALNAAQVILAEDTRVTLNLLRRYDIQQPLERYDEFTAAKRTPEVIARLRAGTTFALVSDAGTPGISDPGSMLVDAALKAEIPVDVLPGPSAIVTALVASGLPTNAFYFGGFLPRKAGECRRLLDGLAALEATLIFYESPRRTANSLKLLAERFPLREAAMARELTKLHEEVVRASLPKLAREVADRESLKGEVVLLVGPPPPEEKTVPLLEPHIVRALVDELTAEGVPRGQAVKQIALETGMPRKEIYRIAHDIPGAQE